MFDSNLDIKDGATGLSTENRVGVPESVGTGRFVLVLDLSKGLHQLMWV
jgi:hypothetical protein